MVIHNKQAIEQEALRRKLAALVDQNKDVIREQMSILGSLTSERKKNVSAENGRRAAQIPKSAETRQKMAEAQRIRRQKESRRKAFLADCELLISSLAETTRQLDVTTDVAAGKPSGDSATNKIVGQIYKSISEVITDGGVVIVHERGKEYPYIIKQLGELNARTFTALFSSSRFIKPHLPVDLLAIDWLELMN